MTTLDLGMARLRSAASRVSDGWTRFNDWYKAFLPKGLYARALLIIIAPMVILQSVVAFVFMERHWNLVTRHLSAAVVGDIAALAEISKAYPQEPDYARLRKIAQDRMGLTVDFLPLSDMPPPGPKPFFSLLDQALSVELRQQIGRPFWIDTVGRSSLVEIGNLSALDGRHLACAAGSRHRLPAQPDQADSAIGRRRRKLRQGPRSA